MSDLIRLGPTLSLPQRAVTKKFAFMGMSGSGKTYAAGKLVECMLSLNSQVIIFDPVGVWWGLRLSASGKQRGFDIPVLGGVRGDLPLEHTAGRLLAETLAHGKHSCVVDVSMMSKGKMAHFMADFAEEFLEAKKRSKSPVHLVFEEAQVFVPQFVRKGNANAARMLGHLEDLIKIGRNHGVGNSLISQRPQAVNWDVLSQAEVLLAFQMIGIHEKKTIRSWVVENDASPEVLTRLPSLNTGECFFWSPAWLRTFQQVKIDKKQTYDASATPEEAEDFEKTKLHKLDVESFGKRMASFAEEAKENDLGVLKDRVKQLQAEVKALKSRAPEIREVPVEVVVATPTITPKALDYVQTRIDVLVDGTKALLDAYTSMRASAAQPVVRKAMSVPTQAKPVVLAIRREPSSTHTTPRVGSKVTGYLRVVQAVAALESRVGPVPVSAICLYAGISKNSSTASIYPNKAANEGLLEKVDGTKYVLTKAGEALFPREAPQTAMDLRKHWFNHPRVGGKRKDILEYLCDQGVEVATDTLMDAVGISPTSSTASIYPNQLRQLGLVYKNGNRWGAVPELIG